MNLGARLSPSLSLSLVYLNIFAVRGEMLALSLVIFNTVGYLDIDGSIIRLIFILWRVYMHRYKNK